MAGKVVQEKGVNDYGDGIAWIRGSIIGKGAFARVYKATLRNPNSKYKCLPSVIAVKSAEVSCSATLQKEREVLSNLNVCPYVIKCFGEETTTGDNGVMAYNLLLEYGRGGTLADRIKKSGENGLSELEVKFHTRSILRGLNHIHGVGYVHCDLKPDNILLVSKAGKGWPTEFRAKIGDFGLAKRQKVSKKRKLEPYWRGTPMYLSPESVIDTVQEAPSDVWAVGCIVHEMLTGKPIWDDRKNAEDILSTIVGANEFPKIPNGISKEATDFLKRCFVRKSVYRFTCEMLLNHPFVQCLDSDDGFEESEEFEHLNEIESMALVYESNDEFSDKWSDASEDDSSSYWSAENVDDDDDDDDERLPTAIEDTESEVVESEVIISTSNDIGFDRSNKMLEQILPQSISKRRQCCPVNFSIPAGV